MSYAGQPKILKWYNSDLIERLIAQKGPVTKPELVAATKLSLPTVNKIVDELVLKGVVSEGDLQETNGAGRKAKTYSINGDSGTIIIIRYSNRHWSAQALDLLGFKIDSAERILPEGGGLTELYELIDLLIERVSNVKIIGVSIPGVVMNNGLLTSIPAIPALDGVNLCEMLASRYEVRVLVENDVKLMTLGYYSEEMHEKSNMAFVYVGERIGAGLIINGQLYKGFNSFAGEFGYMFAGTGNNDDILYRNGGNLESSLAQSDANEFNRYLAIALANCAAVVNPEVIVLYSDESNMISIDSINRELSRLLPKYGIPELFVTYESTYESKGLVKLCNEEIRYKCWLADAVEEMR